MKTIIPCRKTNMGYSHNPTHLTKFCLIIKNDRNHLINSMAFYLCSNLTLKNVIVPAY